MTAIAERTIQDIEREKRERDVRSQLPGAATSDGRIRVGDLVRRIGGEDDAWPGMFRGNVYPVTHADADGVAVGNLLSWRFVGHMYCARHFEVVTMTERELALHMMQVAVKNPVDDNLARAAKALEWALAANPV